MTHTCVHDKQSAILDAAHKRFARFGLAKVTMDEIAADLGISKAALYYYFPTKEDIFRRVVATEQQAFVTRIESIVRGEGKASKKLEGYFEEHLRLLGSLLDLRIIEVRARDSVKPIMRDLFREFSATNIAPLASILLQGKKGSEFFIDSPDATAELIHHVLQGLRIRFFKSLSGREPAGADVRAYRAEVMGFLDILLNGISHQRNGVKQP
jgi:TetR/AcrR family transcriptional regulator